MKDKEIKRRTHIPVQDAQVMLGKFVVDALQENFDELRNWAKSAPITVHMGSPLIRIDVARQAALDFMNGKINAGKLGELLGLMPGEVSEFKSKVMTYGDED